MEQSTVESYGRAVAVAFANQEVLKVSYMNLRGQVSTRLIVPCSPFAVNPDQTMNFQAWSQVISHAVTGREETEGLITMRLDNILSLEKAGEVTDVRAFWLQKCKARNGGTIVFPGPKTRLFGGHYPFPTVVTEHLEAYLERGWTTEPKTGFVQKSAFRRQEMTGGGRSYLKLQ